MRSSITHLACLVAVTALLFPESGLAQVSLDIHPESKLWIEGTSTRSDWTVTAGTIDGGVVLDEAKNGSSVASVQVRIPGKEMAGGKSTIMDRLMHDALQVSEHPDVRYELLEATQVEADGAAFALQTRGRLTLAGATNEVQMLVRGEALDDGRYRYTGSAPLKMTQYGISPPTAMFGALRTGDDVTVHFEIVAGAGQ